VAYGEYTMKKSSVFERHRQLKEVWEDVQDDPRSGQPKTQRTDSNVDRVWTLVCSDWRLGVRLIAEELNREAVRQIITEDPGMRKISTKIVPQILTDDQKQCQLHIWSDLSYNAEMFDGVITSNETWWCFQCDPETKRQSMQWKTQNSPRPKKAHVSLAVQDHAFVFLQSQGHSSLWIHGTRTNSESTVLAGTADKVTGICSEEKTWTLTWQVDFPPWQCPCAWCIKISWVPG
jgi:hypothetical protein